MPSWQILLPKFEDLKRQFAHGEIPKPEGWGGFRIVPDSFEFWQGGHDRLHDRFFYSKDRGCWRISRLSP
jgi:pyridoxamine 5'-phosphate oxidase